MIRYRNGKLIPLTPEEIAELERLAAEAPPPSPTAEERLAALEAELLAAKILLGIEEVK